MQASLPHITHSSSTLCHRLNRPIARCVLTLPLQFTHLLQVLQVPEEIRTDCGLVVSGHEALAVMLYRLAFPVRLKDVRSVFGLADSCICETFNWMLHFVETNWCSVLNLDFERVVPRLPDFAAAIHAMEAPLSNCWGFIDGTVRGIARWAVLHFHVVRPAYRWGF